MCVSLFVRSVTTNEKKRKLYALDDVLQFASICSHGDICLNLNEKKHSLALRTRKLFVQRKENYFTILPAILFFSLFFLVSQIRPAEESICGMPVRILVRQGRQLSGVCVCEEMLLHSCEMRLWWAWAQAKTHTLGESATVIDLSRKWEHCSSRNNTVFGPCASQPASTLDDGRKQIYL